MYFVYVLKSQNDDFHYIGHAADTCSRLKQHNQGKVQSSKAHKPYQIIYTESYATKSEAQKREYFLKRGAGNIWLRNHLKEFQLW